MLYLVAIILGISSIEASDWCAWNRAEVPVDDDNAATGNFINGEFERDYSVSSGGQSELWHGMPYYKQYNGDSCYVETLFLYRYTNSQVYPPTFTWVIAIELGTLPINGYAYCGPDETPSISDLESPDMCNGKWKVGLPENPLTGQAASQATDSFFTVTAGGCPQVNCDTVRFCTTTNSGWANDYDSSIYTCSDYDYYSANTYRLYNTESESNYYYLFFNANVWRWAVNEEITGIKDADDCEQYKYAIGFTAVANVNPGDASAGETPWEQAAPFYQGVNINWFDDLTTTGIRILTCTSQGSTPAPSDTSAPIPTSQPSSQDICGSLVPAIGGLDSDVQIPAEWGCGTPAPVDNTISTSSISPSSGSTPSSPTSPTAPTAPTSPTTADPTQTPAPIATPATPPAQVGTLPPTNVGQTHNPSYNAPVYIPARAPNSPIGPPAMFGTTPSGDGGGSDSANTINYKVAYLLSFVIALYKLLF